MAAWGEAATMRTSGMRWGETGHRAPTLEGKESIEICFHAAQVLTIFFRRVVNGRGRREKRRAYEIEEDAMRGGMGRGGDFGEDLDIESQQTKTVAVRLI